MTQNIFKTLPDVTDLPEIGLYMDQLLELLDKYLSVYKRHAEEPVFTKTMINNYVKAGVITPPIKKRYTQDTMIELIMVFIFKQVYSINDTAILIQRVVTTYKGDHLEAYVHFKKQWIALEKHDPTDHLNTGNPLEQLLLLSLDSVMKKLQTEKILDHYDESK